MSSVHKHSPSFRKNMQVAIDRCRNVLSRHPADYATRLRLGELLKDAGKTAEAEQCFREALACAPDSADVHNTLGRFYHETGSLEEAAIHYKEAIRCSPNCLDALCNLGLILRDQGCYDEALDCFKRALTYNNDPAIRVRLACLLPAIPSSKEQILDVRSRMKNEIEQLIREKISLTRPLAQIGMTPFYNSYHGECNRDVFIALAKLYEQACPALTYTAPHCLYAVPANGRIKIGFISRFMHKHSIGRTTSGLVAQLSRDLFEVYVICIPPFIDDELSRSIKASADNVIQLGATLPEGRRQIAALELDILFYQDIGMDPYSYFLAFSRLAPVQCVTFGHPDTTGIPNMDSFISSNLFETEGAESHYSEELFQLNNVGTLAYYYRPELTTPAKSRADFGLPENNTMYLCPQALFKFHPDFDAVLFGILRKDPEGLLVLVESAFPEVTRRLKERLASGGSDVSGRIRFLPRMGGDDFLHLIAVADVMLDTIHFNGMNTSLEAFSVGTPIVTLPGELQRSRHTSGMYRRMGIDDGIAENPESYISIAVEYATDRLKREAMRQRILEKADLLFEDRHIVEEFQRFFLKAHEQKRQHIPALKVAVITPYYQESPEILERCHQSVLDQTYPCTHIMVADGHPATAIQGWNVEHIILPDSHHDNGDTPRAIGSVAAIGQGFDAIAYLDADNSYTPDHIESLVRLHLRSGPDLCTSGRTIHRFDGSQLPIVELGDSGQHHVDTSCLFLTRPAFPLVTVWAGIPKELAPICDRVFWAAVQAHKLSWAHTGKDTVAFCSRYAEHYRTAGEEPPAEAKPSSIVDTALECWYKLKPEEKRRLFGLPVQKQTAKTFKRSETERTDKPVSYTTDSTNEYAAQASTGHARFIAFYLPQFHPVPENDVWWGKGFTEWTNVGKATPLFEGHYQPRVPADLGYYDLRVAETRKAQADLAKSDGIEAFCYWHYWFAGHRLLERPFEEVLKSGTPDFPFCLGWANQSWTGIWHGAPERVLIEQTYPGLQDYKAHFEALLPAFRDSRYVKVRGNPLFIIFAPDELPDACMFTSCWQELAQHSGLGGIHFVAYNVRHPEMYGCQSCADNAPFVSMNAPQVAVTSLSDKPAPLVSRYEELVHYLKQYELADNEYPVVIPNWDNTPRCGSNGFVLSDSTPELFGEMLEDAVGKAGQKSDPEERIIFIKSWNEWGEGNHLEPDLLYGHRYLEMVRKSLL